MQQYNDQSDDVRTTRSHPFDYILDEDFWADNDSWMFEDDPKLMLQITAKQEARLEKMNQFVKDRDEYLKNPSKASKELLAVASAPGPSTTQSKKSTVQPSSATYGKSPDHYHYCSHCDQFNQLPFDGATCHDYSKHPKFCPCKPCTRHVKRMHKWLKATAKDFRTIYAPKMKKRHSSAGQYEAMKDAYFAMMMQDEDFF